MQGSSPAGESAPGACPERGAGRVEQTCPASQVPRPRPSKGRAAGTNTPLKAKPQLNDEETPREAAAHHAVPGGELVAPAPLPAANTPAPRAGRIWAQPPGSPHGTKLWSLVSSLTYRETPSQRPSCVSLLFLNSSSLYTCRPILRSLATTNPPCSSS